MAGAQTRGAKGLRAPTDRQVDAERRRRRRDADAPLKAAYQAGYSGKGPDREHWGALGGDELAGQYDQGVADRQARADQDAADEHAAARSERLGGYRDRGLSAANEGAGIILGLIGFGLGMAFITGGRAGARAWLAAKFLNRPSGEATRPRTPVRPATPATPSRPGQ